jgi:His-Xaa-Ser system radical SAM maturase HxsC
MIPLRTGGRAVGLEAPMVARVSHAPVAPADPARAKTARVLEHAGPEGTLEGYAAILTQTSVSPREANGVPVVLGCATEHLADGDVVRVSPSGHVETLYRRASPHNTILATERCNSYCVMCSQPPRDVDDAWRVAESLELIALIDPATGELGISGGEPTLLGDDLLRIVAACRDHLPATSLHVLTNGRRFRAANYADALGRVRHPDLMLGIPLYADADHVHDYVVQSRGAFNETMLGLHHLARAGVNVEIRVVLHRDTVPRLPELARFIYRNLTFASHVALMGLEIVGFAKANLKALWVDPADYASALEEACGFLSAVGLQVSIYNHQLCTLPESLWPFARRSISDWKNEYAPECSGCRVRAECGGFFAWNLGAGRSRLLRAL